MKFPSLIVAATAGAMFSTAALAADPVYGGGGFDWDGFYAGLGVTGSSLTNVATETTGYIDVYVGGNATNGDFLFGAEAWLSGYSISSGSAGVLIGAEARAGYLASSDALLYVSAGGVAYGGGAMYGTLGAGVEFAVTDDVSLDFEYKYWGWSNNNWSGHSIGASALWHF